MSEQYQNLATTTCTGSLDSTTNPITVVVPAGLGTNFPATTNGPFRITVCDATGTNAEVMLVTSRATDTMTATRGNWSSTVGANEIPTPTLSTHSAGSVVAHCVTVGALNQVRKDLAAAGAFSGLPATGGAHTGDRYVATDSVFDEFIYNGSIWQPYIAGLACTTMGTSTFSTSLVGGGAVVDTYANSADGAIVLVAHYSSGSDNVVAKFMAVPAAPYTKRMRFYANTPWANFNSIGMALSDGTKIWTIGPTTVNTTLNGVIWRGVNWTNSTTASAEDFHNGYALTGRGGCYDMEIVDDSTNRIVNIYYDGINKVQVHTELRTAFFTPTLIGFFVIPYASQPTTLTVAHWA